MHTASFGVDALFSALDERDLATTINVHRWMDRSSKPVKLYTAFPRFAFLVRLASGSSELSRFYWFPRKEIVIDEREEVTPTSFPAFRAFAAAVPEPDLWVWEPVGSARSPDQLPVLVVTEAPRTPQPAAPSRHSGRSSAVQREFRASLIRRDGLRCTLCGRVPVHESALDAAHVVRHGSSSAVMEEAGLVSTNDVRNGVMLCTAPCHFWYDQLHWWLRADGSVAASEALLASRADGAHFRPRVGQPMLVPASLDHWPRPSTWAVQERLCAEAAEGRRKEANVKEFSCVKCGVPFMQVRGLRRHAAGCTATSRRLLFTPEERRTLAPGLLDFVEEDGGDGSTVDTIADDDD